MLVAQKINLESEEKVVDGKRIVLYCVYEKSLRHNCTGSYCTLPENRKLFKGPGIYCPAVDDDY